MAEGLKYFVPHAEAIWGMFLKVKNSHQKIPGIASTPFPLILFQNKKNKMNTVYLKGITYVI